MGEQASRKIAMDIEFVMGEQASRRICDGGTSIS